MRATEYRANWPLRIAGTLVCLCLISVYLMSGMYAKFTSHADGSDSARVAQFDITETGISSAELPVGDMLPGDIKTYTFTVTNRSEVSVVCLVDVATTGNLPLTFSIRAAGEDAKGIIPGDPVETNIMSHSGASVQYMLDVVWPQNDNHADYADLLDAVKLIVTAQQAD